MSLLNWNQYEEKNDIPVVMPFKVEDLEKPASPTVSFAQVNESKGGFTGLEELKMGAARIRVDDKKIINCFADLNQLVPFKYNWAWDKYLAACANHWMPGEINMSPDIALWKRLDGLTEDERMIVKRNLGFF